MNRIHLAGAGLFILFLFSGCAQENTSGELPSDLSSLRALHSEKKKEIKDLKNDILKIEEAIETLDPSSKNSDRTLVTTFAVSVEDFNHYVEFQGSVKARDEIQISSQVGGRLISLLIREGDAVRKGQNIGSTDSDAILKQLSEVRTSLELATDVYTRQSRLWEQNIGSELQYLEAKNNKDRLERTVETLENQLSKTKIYSPISGIVERVFIEQGEMTGPGTPIVLVIDNKRMKIQGNIPENYLGSVKKGETVQVSFPSIDLVIEEKVTFISQSINPSNRTFIVEVEADNPSGMLRPNLLSYMQINDYKVENAIAIPIEIVQQEVSGRDYVMVVIQEDNVPVARKQYIDTGSSYIGSILIENGLEGSETLVHQGGRGLADGSPLEIFKASETTQK